MMVERMNPFDDEQGIFVVLVNGAGQFSLWPEFAPIPSGWSVAFGPDSRAACIACVEDRWAGVLRPSTLSAA
jgi:MbtH protein